MLTKKDMIAAKRLEKDLIFLTLWIADQADPDDPSDQRAMRIFKKLLKKANVIK